MKKKIWFLFLCGMCLTLAWCFHIPDEDWIFTKDSPTEEKNISHEELKFIDSVNTVIDKLKKDNQKQQISGDISDELGSI